tara:strand:- start:623 stop:1720 length:1098 start_codon:yes stop_codon:yes gene_type:complete
MGIAPSSAFWSSRLAGNDPTAPVGDSNTAFTLASGDAGDGSATTDGYWRITDSSGGQIWSRGAESNGDMTVVAAFKFVSPPDNGETLLSLDNGSKKVELKSKGTLTSLDFVGATTVTITDLDLSNTEDRARTLMVRMTLDHSGNSAKLYLYEIIEDDDAQTHYKDIVPASGSSAAIKWGNGSGSVDWSTIYYTNDGAYSPDQIEVSSFTSNTLLRTGLNIVNVLKNSKRYYLKDVVGDANILYAYDLSSNMISRAEPPSIHVFINKLDSPTFATLSATKTDQNYTAIVYIVTKGTDYKNAYRLGISIMGDVFDELYTKTGLEDGIDSLVQYESQLDNKLDPDEVVCVHVLRLTYMKRIDMKRRQV